MKRRSQSGTSNFYPELRKNALLISQSYFSHFALHMIKCKTGNHVYCVFDVFIESNLLVLLLLLVVGK